jgi:hypothetical protein
MAKYTPETLQGGFSDKDTINAEFQKIATIINTEMLSRSNQIGEPNQLQDDIDVNSKILYNIPAGTEGSHAVNYAQLVAFTGTGGSEAGLVRVVSEILTATAGQTAFTLTAFTYVPGAGSIAVYINGVRQYTFTETSTSVITFDEALDEGDQVLVTAGQLVSEDVPAYTDITTVRHEGFVATAGQTVFTLVTPFPTNVNAVRPVIDGVVQSPSAFSLSGGQTVTFSEGLTEGAVVDFYVGSVLTSSGYQDPRYISVADYTELRALSVSSLTAGQVVHVTNSGIGGEFIIRNVTGHGLTDDAGVTIVIDANWYAERQFDGAVSVKWFGAVGDGTTDDTSAIQAAIDYVAALSEGGTVEIPQSTAEYIFTQITNKTKVTLLSTGGRLKLKDNTANNAGTSFYPVGNLTGTDVGYVNLIIDGNSANNTLFNVCDSITCTGEGSFVIGCRLFDAADSGIMFSNATHGRCLDNYIVGTTDAGIYINATEASNNLEGAVVANNSIQDADYGGINVKRGAANLVIDGNTIENCGNGITFEDFGVGGGGNPEDVVVTNNIFRDIGWNFRSLSPAPSEVGIAMQHARNCTIVGNKFMQVSGVILDVNGAQRCTITGNNCRGYPADPRPTSFGNVGCLLTNRNKATGSHDGANNASVLTDTSQSFIVNDLVGLTVNNTTDGSSGIITANTATTVTATLSGGTDDDWDTSDAYTIVSIPKYNSISANVFTSLEDEGIYLNTGEFNVVSHNIVTDNDNAGGSNQALRVDATCTDNIITDNVFDSPTNDVTVNTSATDNIVGWNKLGNGTGTARNGFQRSTGVATPVGNITPRFSGEIVNTTSGGQKLWMSHGLLNTEWLQIG